MNMTLMMLALGSVLAIPSHPALRGGWATITVENPPDHAVAGRPLHLEFTVRRHGVTLMKGLKPTIEMRAGGAVTRVAAVATKQVGRYAADLVFPRVGTWSVVIHSGFHESRTTLAPLPVVADGAVAPQR